MGDHTEAISIDYDPEKISYSDLLTYFWNGHRCDKAGYSVQYMNAVFYRNEEQKRLAQESLEKQAKKLGITSSKVKTKVLPAKLFTYAEEYHQKYYLTRYKQVRNLLSKSYSDAKSLADSTVATRLNAYLGSGMERDWDRFAGEIPKYGLPDELASQLIKAAQAQN